MKRNRLKSGFSVVKRRAWLPIVEPLESRAVLSVCGVTCDLADGVLSVQGTPADDLIAVRYDAEASSVSVHGRNDELIGQFPLADIRGLNIDGLGGNDDLHVDSPLHQAMTVNGAEGENSLGSGGNVGGHQHGAIVLSSGKTTSSTFVNYGPSFGPSLSPTLNSSNAGSTSPGAPSSSGLATTTSISADHGSHGVAAADFGLVSHVHDSPLAGAMMSSIAGAVSIQSHNHFAAYRPAETASVDGATSRQGSSFDEEASGSLELDGHGRHAVAVTTIVSSTKLVAKPCTVSYSGGLVVTSVDGMRQCNCDQKKQAAEEVKQVLAGTAGGDGLAAAAVDCVPCQQSGGLFGLPSEFQSCSLPPGMDGMPLAMLEEHHAGSACPTRSSAEDAEATDAAWLASLQYVGWPLVAASVALVPAMWERREKEDEAEDAEPAVDWLFGRFHVELLLAR